MLRPRLDALNVPHSRYRVITDRVVLPDDAEDIGKEIKLFKAVAASFDPISSFATNLQNDQTVRRTLDPVVRVAEETGAAVLFNRHVNNTKGRNALYEGQGAITLAGVSRSVIRFDQDPDDGTGKRRLLMPVRNSWGERPPALIYTIEGGDGVPGQARWHGVSPYTINDLGKLPASEEARDDRADTVAFLRERLGDGQWHKTKEVVKDAKDKLDVSPTSVKRARKVLKVEAQQFWNDSLERQEWWIKLPDDPGGQRVSLGTNGPLAPGPGSKPRAWNA